MADIEDEFPKPVTETLSARAVSMKDWAKGRRQNVISKALSPDNPAVHGIQRLKLDGEDSCNWVVFFVSSSIARIALDQKDLPYSGKIIDGVPFGGISFDEALSKLLALRSQKGATLNEDWILEILLQWKTSDILIHYFDWLVGFMRDGNFVPDKVRASMEYIEDMDYKHFSYIGINLDQPSNSAPHPAGHLKLVK